MVPERVGRWKHDVEPHQLVRADEDGSAAASASRERNVFRSQVADIDRGLGLATAQDERSWIGQRRNPQGPLLYVERGVMKRLGRCGDRNRIEAGMFGFHVPSLEAHRRARGPGGGVGERKFVHLEKSSKAKLLG